MITLAHVPLLTENYFTAVQFSMTHLRKYCFSPTFCVEEVTASIVVGPLPICLDLLTHVALFLQYWVASFDYLKFSTVN